jgi:hypothetical protein
VSSFIVIPKHELRNADSGYLHSIFGGVCSKVKTLVSTQIEVAESEVGEEVAVSGFYSPVNTS